MVRRGGALEPDRYALVLVNGPWTSVPLAAGLEITGHPVVTLYLASTGADGASIAYLENVAPDGHLRYISEGQLRGVMRAVTEAPSLYRKYGPHRSESRADALPPHPGKSRS